MLMCTTDSVPGLRIVEVLGLVKGNTIRARDIGHDIMAHLKNLVGGEVIEYTKMLAETREQCLDRLETEAKALGANAIVGLRFSSSEVMQGASELLAYGTAVRLERE